MADRVLAGHLFHQKIDRIPVMIILKVTFDALPAKRRELEQTLFSMVASVGKEAGCEKAEACGDLQNENHFFMLLHWENREKLDAYLQSDSFSALMGTRILLSAPPSVSIDTVSRSDGMKDIAKSDSM